MGVGSQVSEGVTSPRRAKRAEGIARAKVAHLASEEGPISPRRGRMTSPRTQGKSAVGRRHAGPGGAGHEAVENPSLDVGANARLREDMAGRRGEDGGVQDPLLRVKISTWGRSQGKGPGDRERRDMVGAAGKGDGSGKLGDACRHVHSSAATNPYDSDARDATSRTRSPAGSPPAANTAPAPAHAAHQSWFASAEPRSGDAPGDSGGGGGGGGGGAGGGTLLEGLMEGMSSLWRTASSAGAAGSAGGETNFSSRTRHPAPHSAPAQSSVISSPAASSQGNPPTLGADVSAAPGGRGAGEAMPGGRRGRRSDRSVGSGRWGVTLQIPDPRDAPDPGDSRRVQAGVSGGGARGGDLEAGEGGGGQTMRLAKPERLEGRVRCLSMHGVRNALQRYRKTLLCTRC